MNETAHSLVDLMFTDPKKFRSHVEKLVSRNYKLSSQTRRELTTFAFEAFKWRDRIWNQKPQTVDIEKTQALLESFRGEKLAEVSQKIKSLSTIQEQARHLAFPVWLLQSWVDQFGLDDAIEIAWVQNQRSELCIRSNDLKQKAADLPKALQFDGVEVRAGNLPGSFYLLKKINIRGLPSFKRGFFEVQDEHSQQACVWAAPKPYDFIIDGCSRTGGKALHLAALQKNGGKITSVDIDARVFAELEKRAKRLGVTTIKTQWIGMDDPSPCPDLREKADMVFIDAPCSGSGTIRHSPAVRWTLEEKDIEKYHETQTEILHRQCKWVKPGGTLVYVTCSILKRENEDSIQVFLEKHPEFTVVQQEKMLPKDQAGDGFFFAKLKKQ